MPEQVGEFGRMIDYLLARNVHVKVVLLPQGSWENNLPFERAYQKQIEAVCGKRTIQLLDWSTMLKDEDFADSNHPNLYGMDVLQDSFMGLALPFLRSTHALP